MRELQKFLTDKTEAVFELLATDEFLASFTFVGGSALASYLHHRLSEDLDFFTWEEVLPKEINSFLLRISNGHTLEIVNSSSTLFDVFLDGVKVTFFANNWMPLKSYREPLLGTISVASLELLCSMKLNTLALRAVYRDYYDLYILNKEKFSLSEMFALALNHIPGTTKKVLGMQITYIDDITDEKIPHLLPKSIVTLEEIQKHFEAEFRKII